MMAEGRSRQLWAHTSEVLALIHNCNCKPGNERTPASYNPHPPRPQAGSRGDEKLPMMGVEVLKGMFVDPPKKQ